MSYQRVIQITDFHLYANPEDKLLGINTRQSFADVLSLVAENESNIDAILTTGDISQDASAESYAVALASLQQFNTPIYWLSGNHDMLQPMVENLANQQVNPSYTDVGNWRYILLNSAIPNAVEGELFTADLAFLQQALSSAEDRHVLIALHHHPVPMGSAWLDAHQVASHQQFFTLLATYPNVRVVLWGHVHQQYDAVYQDVRLLGTPSTCVQFKPYCADFTLDELSPGYRWLHLHDNGTVETGVERVSTRYQADINAGGY